MYEEMKAIEQPYNLAGNWNFKSKNEEDDEESYFYKVEIGTNETFWNQFNDQKDK